jgi:hypothetical protein
MYHYGGETDVMKARSTYKRRRMNTLLADAAATRCGFSSAHVFIGGTGAVGGAALLSALALYEEMFALVRPGREDVPLLLATGKTEDDIRLFTRRLFRFLESRHGERGRPSPVREAGYLTASGVFVGLERFDLALLPGLEGVEYLSATERESAIRSAVDELSAKYGTVTLFDGLTRTIMDGSPFYAFLSRYAKERLPAGARFQSTLVGIPLPSLIAYHHQSLELVAKVSGELLPRQLEELKQLFTEQLNSDLVRVLADISERVIIAHTTGVGGMYDEITDGERVRTSVRLGFAHAAQDEYLAEKHHFAKALASLYAEAGLLTLITSAAIGVDEVRIDERVPLHPKLIRRLFDLPREMFPGAKATQPVDSKASKRAGRAVPARQYLRIYRPAKLPLSDAPRSEPLTFERGDDLRPRYAIRSGENGFFSPANAEALYRTMRVASASELGVMLATVALFGDDPIVPWFPDCVCHYTETDYSRQVFDFLRLPDLMRSQLGGLEPMALQDLGSSKHQGELHTLGLLILLHRLRSLDLDAIDPYVDPDHFDVKRFFLENSRALTFEDLEGWDVHQTAAALAELVGAEGWRDLLALNPAPSRIGLFPARDRALQAILETVMRAVWAVPSLGTPVIYQKNGVNLFRAGYFVAPLDLVMEDSDSLHVHIRREYDAHRKTVSYGEFVDFHICDRGFVDLRPSAIVSTAKTIGDGGIVTRASSETEFVTALSGIRPYSYFTTCGLLAVLFRLRHLYGVLTEARIELGTAAEFRWQMPRDDRGHILVLPGACEAFRMVSEGLEKSTGVERLDGYWGYQRARPLDRREEILAHVRQRHQRESAV